MYNSEFNIKDISIGHYTDEKNGTGSTVIIAKKGAVVGVSVRGSAPGTRETDLADPKWFNNALFLIAPIPSI